MFRNKGCSRTGIGRSSYNHTDAKNITYTYMLTLNYCLRVIKKRNIICSGIKGATRQGLEGPLYDNFGQQTQKY